MIISHKYRYLFIETPHTASTAISKELCEYYDGEPILYKHTNYLEFEKIATNEEKEFFVFAGVRNPLDEIVSIYLKLLNNHKSNFTDPKKLRENGGWVTEKDIKMYNFVQDKKIVSRIF